MGAVVRMRPLKDFVLKLPVDHPLRVVISAEDDMMNAEEFCYKLKTWLRLIS